MLILKKIAFIYFLCFLWTNNLLAHKDHKDDPKMPAIGVVKGMILDSTSSSPLQYASISIVNLHSNEVVTGGLSEENGRFGAPKAIFMARTAPEYHTNRMDSASPNTRQIRVCQYNSALASFVLCRP